MCPYCHQPVLPSYYFCPNCGTKLNEAPLSISPMTQAWIYAFSVMLPAICYLFITRWPGWKYYKSQDRKTKVIGCNAIVLLVFSSVFTFWLAYVLIDNAIQSSLDSINQELNAE
jgi:zinc ribbon protein